MDLLSLKLIVLGISGGLRLFFGLIPLLLFRSLAQNVSGKHGNRILKYVISVLMFFGGGVLLATCFLHMMPEVRSSLATVPLNTDLPVPELIFIAGFFLVYLLEEVVHTIIHRRRKSKIKSDTGTKNKLQFQTQVHQHSNKPNEFYLSPQQPPHPQSNHTHHHHHNSNGVNRTTNGIDPKKDFDGIYGRRMHSSNGSLVTPGNGSLILPRVKSPAITAGTIVSNPNPNFCKIDPEWWRDTVDVNSQLTLVSSAGNSIATLDEIPMATNGGMKGYGGGSMTPSSTGQSSPEWSPTPSIKSGHGHSHSHIPAGMDEDESMTSTIRNLLIVVALSFHGVFEGLAIGLQGTEKDVWALFLAVSLHECTILFCIGVELISAQTKVIRMITYITVVSLVSPLGIAIGIVISEKSVAGTVAQTLLVGSLQGLAAGTLLYVTFFEIFAAEGRKLHNKFIHILVAMIGFVMMASLELLGGHGHAHGHGASHGQDHGQVIVNHSGTDEDHHLGGGVGGSHGGFSLIDHDDHDHDGHVH